MAKSISKRLDSYDTSKACDFLQKNIDDQTTLKRKNSGASSFGKGNFKPLLSTNLPHHQHRALVPASGRNGLKLRELWHER